jgi:fructuronate reductase
MAPNDLPARLSLAALPAAHATARRPGFDPRRLGVGIVHLGCGAFHRAHQAMHTQLAIEAEGGDWGIAGVSLRSAAVTDALAAQDGLYGVLVRGAGEESLVINGAVRAVFGPDRLGEALQAMARPQTRVITATVTEKGYCHDPATGALDPAHPDIVHDLAPGAVPRSAPGMIVAALEARRDAGAGGLAVLSCDNLPENGATTSRIITALAALRAPGLARWIEDNVSFPSSMVDRIVPAVADADRAAVAARLGLRDEACVATELFTQWVIEDRFARGRPAWERGGATLVSDVQPFERMKLRLLNGSHSLLAYLGYLAGHRFVADAIGAPGFAALVQRYWDEVAPTLVLPAGVDLAAYRAQLLARFANPHLAHRTWQIAMDGSQKLPQRLLAPIAENLAAGRPIAMAALGVAGWMRYVRGVDEQGGAIDVRDPLAARLATHAGGSPAERVDALLAMPQVFGAHLRGVPALRMAILSWLEKLEMRGAARVVREAAAA